VKTDSRATAVKLNYSEITQNIERALSDDEREVIYSQLKKVEISNDVVDIISTDPDKSSREIVYYRNLKVRVFSAFDKVQEDFLTSQNFNLYLIDQIPKARITRQIWPKVGLNTALRTVKTGNITEIDKIIKELIFLLRIKEDIDYTETQYKGFSPIVNWLMKTILKYRRDGGVAHVTLTPGDHLWLCKNLKTDGETIAYKLFQQTIALLVLNASLTFNDEFHNRLRAILAGQLEGFSIKRNQTDLADIEPYYIWNAVTTPEERGILIKCAGENFFNEQNRLLRKFRNNTADTAIDQELRSLKARVDKRLAQGAKATIYGRLRFYSDLKREPEITQLLTKRAGTKQLSIGELHRYAKERGRLSIFAPENILATALDIIKKPIEIMDLTRCIYLNSDTNSMFYYKQDVESCLTVKTLYTHREERRISVEEEALLAMIETRMIQFIPGVSRRA